MAALAIRATTMAWAAGPWADGASSSELMRRAEWSVNVDGEHETLADEGRADR